LSVTESFCLNGIILYVVLPKTACTMIPQPALSPEYQYAKLGF
jgi:hypothetical protein